MTTTTDRTTIAEKIIKSDAARMWFTDYLRSHQHTVQRQSAISGLRGALHLALNGKHEVRIIEGKRRADVAVSIDGNEPRRVAFYLGDLA